MNKERQPGLQDPVTNSIRAYLSRESCRLAFSLEWQSLTGLSSSRQKNMDLRNLKGLYEVGQDCLILTGNVMDNTGLPRWLGGEESACQCRRHRFSLWAWKIPWRKKWQPASVFLPWKSHGQRNLGGYSPWGHKESDKACTHSTMANTQPDVGQLLPAMPGRLYFMAARPLHF